MNDILKSLKNGLIVSCQALKGEPLYLEDFSIMYLMARAAKKGGAVGIRTESVRDIKAIKKETRLPVIGIIKKSYDGYDSYITTTMEEVRAVANAGADIIATDMTNRNRLVSLEDFMRNIRREYPDKLIMADISTYEEGINAANLGCDIISTTMSGYTDYSPKLEGPDFELIKRLSENLEIPVIAEGRIHYPEDARKALEMGAFSVVVGGAITRPLEITQRFVNTIGA